MSSVNRQELTRKIQSLSDLSADEKSALLELLNTRKKYGLVWEDKPEKVEDDLRSQFPVLQEVVSRRIVGTGENPPNHVLIEGDNLHALTALQYTHAGKIDVIYIDPPYNTENKDFVYNDRQIDPDDQFRHSKWIGFMSRRLHLAKNLLGENSILFISIDDNEVGQLKLLCDEIFGNNTCLGIFSWLRKKKPSFLSRGIIKTTEYVLGYKKSPSAEIVLFGENAYSEKAVPLLNRPNNEAVLFFQPGQLKAGKDVKATLYKKGSYGSGELSVKLENDMIISDGINSNAITIKGRFRWVQSFVSDELNKGSEFYFSDTLRINVYRYDQASKFKSPASLLTPEKGIGTNEDATQELSDIFSDLVKLPFDYPKPVSLVKFLIKTHTYSIKNATILDFFAGSGTTLHATMSLNAEDGGNRQCILVTNNENNICEEVTYERNLRVIKGYTNSKGVAVPGLTGNSLRYYKTAFVERERSQKNRKALTRAAVDLLCLKEDCYAERADLKHADRRVFENAESLLFVLFDPDVIPETVELIKAQTKHCKVYVFSPGAYAWDDEFEEVLDKITLCALPEALIQAFQKVMPKESKSKYYDDAEDAE